MWRLEKEISFEAAHKLPNHHGKCKRLHGHSWRGRIVVEGRELAGHNESRAGMLLDFHDIKAAVDPIVEKYLDHYYLNESLDMADPTSENIAKWLFERVEAGMIPDKHAKAFRGVRLVKVVIEETCTCRCEYWPDDREAVQAS